MNILVIGRGGREHALCWKLKQSSSVKRIFCAPGNPGIGRIAESVSIEPTDIAALRAFAMAKRVDLTVVGPEEPLAIGIVDEFERYGLPIFGPSRAAAQLESSKAFAKNIMRKAGVPTADYAVFDDPDAASRYALARNCPLVVKADGLALGKGVVVCETAQQALAAIDDAMRRGVFGDAGRRVVIEERLFGEEVSYFALVDGTRAITLGLAQDHKPVFDGDRGPNTGGMGAYSPLPHLGDELEERIRRLIVEPTLAAMATWGAPFRGVLYAGLMVNGPRIDVLEFNVRFGDPECEAMMMRFSGDLAEALLAAAQGKLSEQHVRLSPSFGVAVALTSRGYPGNYERGFPIRGLERAQTVADVEVFHAGTALKGDTLVTNGGRVLIVSARGDNLEAALRRAYQAAEMIEFEGKHLRYDIGMRALRKKSLEGN